jgi:DnaK suppressor protein
MTGSELCSFKAVLEAAQTRVEESLGSVERRAGIAIESTPDVSDEAQCAFDRELTIGVLNRESALLSAIKFALARIEDGTYGICAECDGPISVKRLTAVPWACYCIPCQESADNDRGGQDRNHSSHPRYAA